MPNVGNSICTASALIVAPAKKDFGEDADFAVLASVDASGFGTSVTSWDVGSTSAVVLCASSSAIRLMNPPATGVGADALPAIGAKAMPVTAVPTMAGFTDGTNAR
jgi:hypothetical protein